MDTQPISSSCNNISLWGGSISFVWALLQRVTINNGACCDLSLLGHEVCQNAANHKKGCCRFGSHREDVQSENTQKYDSNFAFFPRLKREYFNNTYAVWINSFSPELPSRHMDDTVKFIFNREI